MYKYDLHCHTREGSVDAEALVTATREAKCRYIILSEDRVVDGDLIEEGLVLVDTIDGYLIYEDPEVE